MTWNDVLITGLIIFIIVAAIFIFSGSKYEANNERKYSCDRESEAKYETAQALNYCKSFPGDVYYGDICGVPLKLVC